LDLVKGIPAAVLRFIVVGIAIPFLIGYLAPTISSYVTLPPSSEIWAVFILFGALFAVTAFLQHAFSKGEYPWLFGKIGGGLVSLAFLYYLFLFIPSGMSSETGAEVSATGLISLIILSVVLSYGALVFDFFDARRQRLRAAPSGTPGS
jgi:hypothetical protein